MSHSLVCEGAPGDRGQTEPIVALLAVAIIALAVSMAAGFVTNPLASGNERNVAEATLDPVWTELTDAGVYEQSTSLDEITATSGGSPGSAPATLPAGHYVYVNVSYVGADGRTIVSGPGGGDRRHAVFDPLGKRLPSTVTALERRGFPARATVASRPIPIQYGAGDVGAGRLFVVVWPA